MLKKQRPSTLVDWAFIALDRGMPRKEVARLAWLYVELEDAQNAIIASTRRSDTEAACQIIRAINTELGLPPSENVIARCDIETAQNEIFQRLTGQTGPL